LQQAFVDTGAIQCGFCTPAQILAAEALLTEKGIGQGSLPQEPVSEAEVRDAIGGVLCRCTGYQKPVEAVLLAAKRLGGTVTHEE
jgi:putative selenate reductase molybdopterin-binding subunit